MKMPKSIIVLCTAALLTASFSEAAMAKPHHTPPKTEISAVQTALNNNGAKLKIDGRWGRQTKAALKAYQKSHGLAATGAVGPETRKALNIK
ncbi:MAG: peptidoglycan-binding domain-containing protein [Alphaproteobacteria bacterium]